MVQGGQEGNDIRPAVALSATVSKEGLGRERPNPSPLHVPLSLTGHLVTMLARSLCLALLLCAASASAGRVLSQQQVWCWCAQQQPLPLPL